MAVDLKPVADALDEAIASVESKIEVEQAERDRLVALKASALNGSVPSPSSTPEPVGPSKPAAPPATGKSGHNFTKRGRRYVTDLERAIFKGPKTSVRLREILGTTSINRYLDEAQARGHIQQEGSAPTKGRKTTRVSPVWIWTGPEQGPTAPAGRRSGPRPRFVGGNGQTIAKRLEAHLRDHYGNRNFTKAQIVIDLHDLNRGSVQGELTRCFKEGLIEKTGRKVPGPKGHQSVPEWKVTEKFLSPVPHDPGAALREHVVTPGDGVHAGRLREGHNGEQSI